VTQRDIVLKALRDAGDRGVHSFEFLELQIPRAAARVLELRENGHTITSTRERLNGDAEGVRYRLIEQTPVPVVPVGEPDRLFAPPARPHWQMGDVA